MNVGERILVEEAAHEIRDAMNAVYAGDWSSAWRHVDCVGGMRVAAACMGSGALVSIGRLRAYYTDYLECCRSTSPEAFLAGRAMQAFQGLEWHQEAA